MEQLVLGIFQEHLAKVIIGFRKEQVNANLLNGKGEIKDVILNCALFNEYIAKVCPYIRMEEIHVSRIGFHVTSWANLRKAPIIVDIGHISAKIEEPLTILPRKQRQRIQMITESELMQKLAEGFKPFRGSGSYGLMDRIVDNLTIEIESLKCEFQTWGKFKTKRPGPWTPPLLEMELKKLKVCMVDAEGSEGSPDQAWAHNRGRRDSFLTYKKVEGECQIRLVPQNKSHNQNEHDNMQHELSKLKMEVQIAVERRLQDGAVLACQLDVTIPEVDVDVESTDIRSLAHLASGLQYCFAKDRSFEDPLKSLAESANVRSSPFRPSVVDLGAVQTDSTEAMNGFKETDIIDDNDSLGGENSIKCDESVASGFSDDGIPEDGDQSVVNDSSTHDSTAKTPLRNRSTIERTVIILPNGLIIYESLSLTCSIHKLVLWGSYREDEEKGCLEFVARGCIAEAIWPKLDGQHGFYLQLSTSFVSLEEQVGHYKRTLLLAGMRRDDHLSLRLPSRKPQEIGADEFFPLFERRSIRDDPLDLRHMFPTQAFGLKTTIDVMNQSKDDETRDRFMVLHEIGGDEIEFVIDTDVFLRITRFVMNTDGGGFDPRWETGNWSNLLTPEILRHPDETLHLNECLQECALLFLDENQMISSDLLNFTVRLSNVVMRIPSAVQDSLRSCDIMMKWKETTLVVSSDLPRTFLTGRIGNSISGEAKTNYKKGIIDFPNDPSDICYGCEQENTANAVSTFRFQLTTRGFEVNIVPTIPFCAAPESQKVIAINHSTTIFCFEGEPPMTGSNNMKITVFLSTLVDQLILNIDFDILAGATCTILHHNKQIVAITEIIRDTFAKYHGAEAASSQKDVEEPLDNARIQQSLKGRRILAGRQMSQSRETGGLAIIFCFQQKGLQLRVWRQNVPISSPLRNKLESINISKFQDDDGMMELLNLLDFEMKDLEVGVEFDFHSNSGHRAVIKSCLEHANLRVVDLVREIEEYKSLRPGPSAKCARKHKQWNLINLCSFGNETFPVKPSGSALHFAFRLEAHHKNNAQSWSMAADISAPSTINLEAEAVKALTVLIIESLLLPTWSNNPIEGNEAFLFPPGTIGAMFYSVAKGMLGKQNLSLKFFDSLEIDTNSSDPILERLLRSMCKTFLPLNLQVILLRCEIANLLISIPPESDDGEAKNRNVCFLLNQSDIITRFYPIPGSPVSEIEKVLACRGTDWSTLINTNKEGFYQYIRSEQSLLSLIEKKEATALETVVHPFEVSFTYSGAEVEVSMGKGVMIEDIRLVENIQSRLSAALKASAECLTEIYSVVEAVMYRESPVSVALENKSEGVRLDDGASQKRVCSSFSKTRTLLRKAKEEFRLHESCARDSMLRMNRDLETLNIDLFEKERERFGALSLMASRVAGWIRMGGQHRSGQRVVKKSLLWPFWTVIRKELLILYPRPGEPKPSDIVSLVNAKIRKLEGGSSRQDTKRGFSIIESSGTVRYFVTATAQEYEIWTNEIHSAIRLFSDSSESDGSVDADASQPNVSGLDIENDDTAVASQKIGGIGNRLSSALQSARLKGKEISDRRQAEQNTDQSIRDDNDIPGNSETDDARNSSLSQDLSTSKRVEISKKFSEVGLVTKSRLGSAIQNARDKRDGLTNRRTNNDVLENGSKKDVDSKVNLTDSSIDVNTSNELIDQDAGGNRGSVGPRTGLQLSNKLGSAFQSARMKAIGGSLRGSEQQADDHLTDNTMNGYPMQGSFSRGAINTTLDPLRKSTDSLQSSIRSKDVVRQEEIRSNSRFRFLKRGDAHDDSLSGGDGITLRNIYAGQDIVTPPNTFDAEVPPLKMLSEKWIVKVHEITNAVELSPRTESIHHERKCADAIDKLDGQTTSPTTMTESSHKLEEKASITPPILHVENDEMESSRVAKSTNLYEPQEDLSRFLVKVLRVPSTQAVSSIEKQWSFGDVLRLYSRLSEVVQDISTQQCGQHSSTWNVSSTSSSEILSKTTSFEKVIVCGRVLGGLLEARKSFECIDGFRRYRCESIENFFNDLLECPLPINGLMLLSDALGINESKQDCQPIKNSALVATKVNSCTASLADDFSEVNGHKISMMENDQLCPPLCGNHFGRISNLLTACEAEIQLVETMKAIIDESKCASMGKNAKATSSIQIQPIFYEPLLPPTLTQHIHNSIHKSLMDAIVQRDEAHAQLVNANIMHTNSLERMRKKNERLEIDASFSQEIARVQLHQKLETPNIANFFGQPDEKVKRMQREIDQKIDKVHHFIRKDEGEAEIMDLSSQLASEMSTKTSLALEIDRLKQTSETQTKTQLFEKEALQDEIRRLRDLLEVERQKNSNACAEAAHWKALYEESRSNHND